MNLSNSSNKWGMFFTFWSLQYVQSSVEIVKILTIIYDDSEATSIKSALSLDVGNILLRYRNSYGITPQMWIYRERKKLWIRQMAAQLANSLQRIARVMKYSAWNHLIFIRFKTHFHFRIAIRCFISNVHVDMRLTV